MPVKLSNNASSRLASSLSTGATNISVMAGEGAKFPLLEAGQWFPLTIVKASGALEIVKATSRSGDVITVTRAQEGTSAQAFAVGDRVELRLTVAAITEIVDMINSLRGEALLDSNNLSDLADREAARDNLSLTTAATTALQSGAFDQTAGRIMTTGAGGLLGDLNYFEGNFNDTTIVPQGWCYIPLGTVGTRPIAGFGFLRSFGVRTGGFTQEWYQVTGAGGQTFRKFRRDGYNNHWGAWVEAYDSANTGAIATAIFSAANAAEGRAAINAMAADASLIQGVETLWSGNVSAIGVALPLARPLVAGDIIWIDHADARSFPSHPLVLSANRMVSGAMLPFTFGNGWTEVTFNNASQLTTLGFTNNFPIKTIYASKAKV